MEMTFPGSYYGEVNFDTSSSIVGGATDICGVMMLAKSGPINKPTLVHSIDEAIAIFGSYMSESYGMYTVKGFFQEGGRSLYISRLAHYTDITDASTLTMTGASLVIKNATDKDTLSFKSKYLGSDGNNYGIEILDEHRVSVKTTVAALLSAKEIYCSVVRDFVVNDYIKIKSGEVTAYGRIASIDLENRKLILVDQLGSAIGTDATVETCDFKLNVYRKTVNGKTLESSFIGCNLDPASAYYVVNLVNDTSNGSKHIVCEDEHAGTTDYHLSLPIVTTLTYLSGGNDNLDAFSDTDIMGDALSGTGNYAFDKITKQIHVWCPESSRKEVIRAGYNYWQNRGTGMFFAVVPNGMNPDAAATFRDEAGWNTSFGVLYHNWGYVSDPIGIGNSPEKLVPLTGHVLGAMAKHDRTSVDGYGSAPAGETMILSSVSRLEFDVDRTNGGVMYGENNRNINPIVSLSNNGGIAVWGSRTQSADSKWFQIHARRVFIYAELAISEGTRWAVFQNKNDALYRKIQRVVKKFLGTLKGLYGDTDEERFEFVCDTTINNTIDSVVNGRVALNITSIGEFVYFEFGQKPDGVSIAEI